MTSEDREDIKRYLGVVVEGLRSDVQQVAEGVTANGEALDRFRDETAREFAAVRSEAGAFRVETARNFAAVRSEADAFRDETALNFVAVRSEIAGSRISTALPRRPRTRRRPN